MSSSTRKMSIARLTVSARLTARLAVVFATARRRVRRAEAVEGIPATRPPSDAAGSRVQDAFEGDTTSTSKTPKNDWFDFTSTPEK